MKLSVLLPYLSDQGKMMGFISVVAATVSIRYENGQHYNMLISKPSSKYLLWNII